MHAVGIQCFTPRRAINHLPKYAKYSTVQYSTVQYSTVQYSTVQYSTVQYNTIQYNTINNLGKWFLALFYPPDGILCYPCVYLTTSFTLSVILLMLRTFLVASWDQPLVCCRLVTGAIIVVSASNLNNDNRTLDGWFARPIGSESDCSS